MLPASVILNYISINDVVTRYGYEINRQGFIQCPFHSEDTPSMKIYTDTRTYYCFGCGASGDVIKFVKQLFNLDYAQTVEKINRDFNLNLPIGEKRTIRQNREFEKIQREYEKQQISRQQAVQELKRRQMETLTELVRLDRNLSLYKPSADDTELHPLFVEALRNVDKEYYLKYLPLFGGG